MVEEVNTFFGNKVDEAIDKMKEAGAKRVAKAREKSVKDALKARTKGENTFSDQEIESLADVVAREAQDREEHKQNKRREEINAVRDHIKRLLGRLKAGHIYVVPQDLKQASADMFTQSFGTFVGFKFNKSYTLGSSTAIFATLDGRRKVELALNDNGRRYPAGYSHEREFQAYRPAQQCAFALTSQADSRRHDSCERKRRRADREDNHGLGASRRL